MDPVYYSLNNWTLTNTINNNNNNHNNNYDIDSITKSLPLEALTIPMQRFLVCLYSATAIISFCGNTAVLLVLSVGRKSSRELKKFLINLSLSDICMSLLSIPFTYTDFMLGRWIFEPLLCPLASTITTCAMCVSVYTLTVIGIDRYFAIMHPLRPSIFISNRPTILAAVWLVGVLVSSPQLLVTRVEPFTYANQSYVDCREDWSSLGGDTYMELYSILLFVVTFALPMTALAIIYGTIGYSVMRRIPVNDREAEAFSAWTRSNISDQRLKATIKAVKMMAMVVIIFAICWTPIQVFNIVIWLYGDSIITETESQMNAYVGSFFVCHWLAMAHSFVNPFVYCFMSDNFKEDCRQIWSRCHLRNHKSLEALKNRNLGSTIATNFDS